jgi:hypothetical protein
MALAFGFGAILFVARVITTEDTKVHEGTHGFDCSA